MDKVDAYVVLLVVAVVAAAIPVVKGLAAPKKTVDLIALSLMAGFGAFLARAML